MQVNGEIFDLNLLKGNSLLELLSYLELKQERIAIEVNEEICAKSEYNTKKLSSSDKIEIIHFVGGG